MAAEEGQEQEEYKVLAEQYKDEGNAEFQKGTFDAIKKSIELYTRAIEMDPGILLICSCFLTIFLLRCSNNENKFTDNKVYYSNRSAAYLKSDSKSKALWDAQKCVELAPDWVKGYSRLGAAQQSLKRCIFLSCIHF